MTSAITKETMHSTGDNQETEMEWTTEEETQLFFALDGLKPVGVNKHFYMACIVDRLSKSLQRNISADAIWAHLRTMYNLELLDEMEPIPFPNEEKEFSLPDDEFSSFLAKNSTASIIAVAMDNTGKDKPISNIKISSQHQTKEIDKKIATKLLELPKRTPKRTRGSMSLESSSPSTTPPPVPSKRRRI